MNRFISILFLLILAGSSLAQNGLSPVWEHQLEQWADQSEGGDIEELADQLALLHDNPINLNDTSQHVQLFFLSPFQIHALQYYIAEYGQLYSLSELYLINGFDSLTIALINPIATTVPYKGHTPISLRNAAHSLTLGSSRAIERSRGFRDSIYAGDPFRSYLLYNFDIQHRIHFQISADKDPGESFNPNGRLPGYDFYGYHLILSNFGKLRKLAIGQYRLQFGQGLTLWEGARPWNSSYGNIYRNAQQITAANPFTEYGCMQGAAATIALAKHLSASFFYSIDNIDATKSDSLSVQSLSHSGYHRTATEISKKDAVMEQIVGANISYNSSRLHIGSTAQYDHFSKTIQPASQPYNQFHFTGNNNFAIGIDASYQLHYTSIFGELSRSLNGGMAGIIGTQTPLGNGNHIAVAYRNYSRDYQNFHTSAWGQGSSTQNEEGLMLSLRCHLPLQIFLQLDVDYFKHPWLKYQTYSPTYGNEQRITLTRSLTSQTQLSFIYRHKEYGRNGIDTLSNTYTVEQVTRQSLKGTLSYQSGYFSCHSDICISHFDCELHSPQSGLMLSQQIAYHKSQSPIYLIGRFSLFDVSGYDAAIYALEGDLRYEYASSTFNHQGMRLYLMARYTFNKQISLSAKYALTAYSDQESIGSGYNALDSNHRQNIKLQLHWNF